MIYDIFITSDAFEKIAKETSAVDGLETLDELLFPRRFDTYNVLIADPHAEHWWQDVQSRLMRLPPQTRDRALSLLGRIGDLVLTSRTSDRQPPESEEHWMDFLKRRENGYIDWIFASTTDRGTESDSVVPTDRLGDMEWVRRNLRFQQLVGRSVASQERLLRKICQQTDWCVAQLPYIRGDDSGSEMATARQLIRLACESVGAGCVFDLNFLCQPPREPIPGSFERFIKSLPLRGRRRVHVRFFWDGGVRDRNFLAGSLQPLANGDTERRGRWLVSAQHVAFGNRSDGQESMWTWGSRADIEAKTHELFTSIKSLGEPPVKHIFGVG